MLYTTNLVGSYTFNNLGRTISYTYDGSGNIATRTDTTNGTSLTTEYFYDELNQLIRENDPVANKTITYTYDNGGNILQKKEYAYTTGVLGTVKRTINYTYDSEWKDLLIKYGNLSVTYDEIGNPITFDGATLTWEQGRKLSSITLANGVTASYKYDANGVRTQKTVAGVTTDYFLQGSTIVAQKTGNNVIWYYFDGDGTRDAIEYNGNVYYYMYNPQGDVIGLFDDNLNVVVEYTYDSWGKILSITGSLASTLGQDNPFRYRGYYYDSETGMYYLNSRYYHPQIGRFINADNCNIIEPQGDLYDKNLFAYCDNNPTCRIDVGGYVWETVFDVASLCLSMAEVATNPADAWAWIGLAADFIDLVPFVTGVGEVTRAVKLSRNIVDVGDDVYDVAKIATSGSPNRIGKIGEQLAGINTKAKQSILVNGRTRIPDALTETTLKEVKNVKYISNTRQLRDFATYASNRGLTLELYVRPTTKVAKTVEDAGWNLKYLW